MAKILALAEGVLIDAVPLLRGLELCLFVSIGEFS